MAISNGLKLHCGAGSGRAAWRRIILGDKLLDRPLTSLVGPARKENPTKSLAEIPYAFRTFVVRPKFDVGAVADPNVSIKAANKWLKGELRPPKIDRMLGSIKRLLLWIAGLLVAAAISTVISFYVIDRFLAAHNPPTQGTRATNAR